MEVSSYLIFDGQCEEAFKFYEKVLNGKIVGIMTWGESPMAKTAAADLRNKVNSAASGSSSIPGRSSSSDLISFRIASIHSDVDLKFDRGNFRFRRSNSSIALELMHLCSSM